MALTDYVLARGATLDDLQQSVLAYAGAKVNALLSSLRTAGVIASS